MIRQIIKKITLIIFLFSFITISFALEPIDILKRAWGNEGTIPLVGRVSTLGYYGDKKVSSAINLYWYPPKKIRREVQIQNTIRLVLISDETSEWRYFPKRNIVIISPLSLESIMTPARWELLQKNYSIKQIETQKIINRPTTVIQIEPKHAGNPSRKLWIDKSQPIVLRSEQYNCDTQLVLTSYFTALNLKKKIDLALFTIPTSARVSRQSTAFHQRYTFANGERYFRHSLKTATYLPSGYTFDGCYLWQPRYRLVPYTIQLRYTDGLNTISIFEHTLRLSGEVANDRRGRWFNWFRKQRTQQFSQERERKRPREPESQRERQDYSFFTQPHEKIIRVVKGNIQCIIIADLPQVELKKIALGLR